MESPILTELFTEYQKVSGSKLTNDQFSTLVMFFPALLVIASDGVIDQEEWIYVKYLSKFIADTYKKEIDPQELAALNQTYYSELEFLIDNLEVWESRYVDALSKHLDKFPAQKETVMETLHLFAEASEGESEEEIEKIEELSKKLHLEE
ncbi:MAG: hypothetical protein ACPGJS_01255 [Flammeovirgaceae bacterium]